MDNQHHPERLLSCIISNTEEAFIVLDKELKITSFNTKFYKLYHNYFGIEVKEKESILFYAQAERLPFLRRLYENVLQGNVEYSEINIFKERNERKISIKYSPIRDESNLIIGVFVTGKDVTEIANYEIQLKTREQELSLIFDNLNEIVFLIHVQENSRFIFKSVNEAFVSASGLLKGQIEGKYVDEIIPEPSLSMVLTKYRQAMVTKRRVSWEEASIYPAGKKTGIVSVNPVFDNEGNCVELIGSIHDITDRVFVEEQIKKIMASSLDIICTIDKEGKFVTVSAASERIWGYTPAMLVGKQCLDFVFEGDHDLTTKFAQQIMQGLETTNFENRYIRIDGAIVPIIWSARWDNDQQLMYCTAKDGTDRLKAEKQLQDSEKRFKSLVQYGSDMIGILDIDGNYRYVSPTSVAILGINPEEFIGKNAFDFIHKDDLLSVSDNFKKVGEQKRIYLSPFRFKHKNGTWRWIETVVTDMLNEPSINGIVTNSRDVTAIINAQKEILLSNERYKYVTKATTDAIWDWDLVSNELYWGEGFQLLFGYDPINLASDLSSWSDKIHPKDVKKVLQSVYQVIDSLDQTNWIYEYWYLKADGNFAYVQDKGFVIRDENGKAIRMVGAMQDISERKREEQQLKLLESVITNATDAILITEAEPIDHLGPRILYVNDAFTKMTGYSSAEVIGKTPRILQGPKTDKDELRKLKQNLQLWQTCEATVVNYKKNGEEFWINFSITPIADETGWFTHWISIERDVTEQKNKEIQKRLLADISQLFNTTHTLTDTLNKVLRTISTAGNYCAAEIWLVDSDDQVLNLLTKFYGDDLVKEGYKETRPQQVVKFGEGLPGSVWKDKVMKVWNVNDTDLGFKTQTALKANMLKGIGIPLFNNEIVNGVLILASLEDERINSLVALSANFGKHLGTEIRRKQVEQELNQLFNFAPDIISISNLEGYFKKVNPTACKLLEYNPDEFLDRNITDFIHPDDKQDVANQLNAQKNRSETYYFENRYLTKSGKIKWLAWASNTLVEEGLVFSVAKDITDKKNLEDLLLKSNSMGKVGSWEIDVIGGTVYWSDITKEIRETEPGFIPTLKTGIHYFKEGRDKETITKKVNDCKLNGTPWDEELQIVTFKGNLKWIRTIGQAEMINGKCIRIYGSFQDIDERKKAELKVQQAVSELEESEKRYSDLFHLSPLPKWVYDVETLQFLDVNLAAINHYGYSYEEFLGMTIKDIRPEGQIPQLHQAIDISLGNGGLFFEGIFLHRNKMGDNLNVEIKSSSITFKGRKAKVVVSNDITERLNYVNAIENQNKKLQEISWIQSHVIRAPLARMMGLIYLLKNKTSQTELSEESIIERIEHAAEELDDKIKEIVKKSDYKEN